MLEPQISTLDLIDKMVRILGWPTLLVVIAWAIRTYDGGKADVATLISNTRTAVEKVGIVEQEVLTMKNNHLVHLQSGIDAVAKSNETAVTVLQNIDTNIKVLVDRTPRV